MKTTYIVEYLIKDTQNTGVIDISANSSYEALEILKDNNLQGAIVATGMSQDTMRFDAIFDKHQAEENDAAEFGYYNGDYHDEPQAQAGV